MSNAQSSIEGLSSYIKKDKAAESVLVPTFGLLATSVHIPYVNKIYNLKVRDVMGNRFTKPTAAVEEEEPVVSETRFGAKVITSSKQVAQGITKATGAEPELGYVPKSGIGQAVSTEAEDVTDVLGDVAADTSVLDEIPILAPLTIIAGIGSLISEIIDAFHTPKPQLIAQGGFTSGISN